VILQLKIKKLHLTGYDYLAFAIIIIATLLRFTLIYFNWPITNSDEGNMGLVALHIAYDKEWPLFFYGQPYMGPIEGYLAAPLFHLLGPSLFTLRLGSLGFYPLFLLSMYYLTIRLYDRKYALFIVLLLSVGSDETILRQVKAVGEYPETIFFAALISLLVVWLVQMGHTIPAQQRTGRQRIWIYGLLGLVIGIAFWVDMLILPIVGVGFLLLWFFCRRELRSKSGISLAIGMIIGAFPLVIYNATAPLSQNSLVVLYGLSHSNGDRSHTFIQQILGTIGISIPDAMNFNPMCIKEVDTLLNGQQAVCAAAQLSWGTGYLLTYGFALVTTALVAWRRWKSTSLNKQEWTIEQRETTIRDFCRLMLLVSAGGTILAYVISPHPATVPAPTARYLTCLLIALPAVLWPVWNGVGEQCRAGHWSRLTSRLSGIMRVGLLLLFLVMSTIGMYNTFKQIPTAQGFYASQDHLIQHLQAIGVTRFYSEYWTCNRLIFQSHEKLICSSLDEKLGSGFDRYIPYRTLINTTEDVAYVFPQNAPQVAVLDAMMQNHTLKRSYQRQEFGNYVIYYIPRTY
jgi:4-amino-4-deoxy-L-arabinose transferase-like glycosyltransferase